MCSQSVNKQMNQIFDQLKEENNRLLKQLLFIKNVFQFFDCFTSSLKDLLICCKCFENLQNKLKFEQLEQKLKTSFDSEKQKRIHEQIEENIRKNLNFFSQKSKQRLSEESSNKISGRRLYIKTQQFNSCHYKTDKNMRCILTNKQSIEKQLKINKFRNDLISRISGIKYSPVKQKTIEDEKIQVNVVDWPTRSSKTREIAKNEENVTKSQIKVEDNSGVKNFYCDKCDKHFKSKLYLNKHKYRVHIDKKYKCDWPQCLFATKDKKILENHTLIKHLKPGEKPFKCQMCDKGFPTKNYLSRHLKIYHLDVKTYACDWPGCEYQTILKPTLKTHMTIHMDEKPFACDWPGCESSFAQNCALLKHYKQIHENIKEFKCVWPQCHKEFNSKCQLETHTNRYHKKVAPFKCSECEKSFFGSNELTKHLRSFHRKTCPRFQCDKCQKFFKTCVSLRTHNMRHTGEKPFKCGINGCQSEFVTKRELKVHKDSIHNDLRPFLCEWPECRKSFKIKSNLTLHYRSHTGYEPKKKVVK